jgi:hypothetical protein
MLASIETKEDLKNAIMRNLKHGESNATKKRDLAILIGAEKDIDQRLMRLMINELRHAGWPIIGSQKGYYLAENIQEILKAREYLTSYIKALCIDLRDLKNLAHNFTGQMSLKL